MARNAGVSGNKSLAACRDNFKKPTALSAPRLSTLKFILIASIISLSISNEVSAFDRLVLLEFMMRHPVIYTNPYPWYSLQCSIREIHLEIG